MSQFHTSRPMPPNTFEPERGHNGMRNAMRQLDQRTSDGVTVTLLWNAETNGVFVSVVEERYGGSFEFAVPAADASLAFHHPYAYAAAGPEDHPLAA